MSIDLELPHILGNMSNDEEYNWSAGNTMNAEPLEISATMRL